MRIIFVRHGHPNYRQDCLTELGHLHAKAVAERLCEEKIEMIYSSTCGRAFETAEHIAQKQENREIVPCDYMREVSWGSEAEELFQKGHPWFTADQMVREGQSLMDMDWANKPPFLPNHLCTESVKRVSDGFDGLMASLGFIREGEFYRVTEPKYNTVAVVSHGGASSAMLARLFNLPFPFLCTAICPNYTAVTIVNMKENIGELVAPQFELVNDARHIKGLDAEAYFGK